jgi:hypothetical protein
MRLHCIVKKLSRVPDAAAQYERFGKRWLLLKSLEEDLGTVENG